MNRSRLNSSPTRDSAYTTTRPDVFAMVPDTASRVLDVGCSNGTLGLSLKQARFGREVVGIEMNEAFAAEAARRLDHVVCADLNELDWRSLSDGRRLFDCIVFADVLEHLTDPGHHLRAASELLASGGSIVISLPNVRHLSSLYAIFVKGTFPRKDRGIFDSTHLRWFTISDARAMAAQIDLRVERVDYALRFGDKGGGLANRLLNRLPPRLRIVYPVREFLTYQFCMRLAMRS